MNMLRNLLAAVLSLCSVTEARANMPQTIEQIFCWAPSAVIGTIVDAESRDCRLTNPAAQCEYIVRIKIRVDSLLVNRNDLHTGDVIDADVQFANELPVMIGDKAFPTNLPGPALSFPATGKVVDTSEAREVLLGKQFILGVKITDNELVSATAWPLTDLQWAKETIADPGCVTHRPAFRVHSANENSN